MDIRGKVKQRLVQSGQKRVLYFSAFFMVLLVFGLFVASLAISGDPEASGQSLPKSSGAPQGDHANDPQFEQPVVGGEVSGQEAVDPVKENYMLTMIDSATAAQLVTDGDLGIIVLSDFDGQSTIAVPKDKTELIQSQLPEAVFEENTPMKVTAGQNPTPSWGLDRIDKTNYGLDSTYNYDTTGRGVRAYVIDTGLNTTHADFTGRVGIGYSTVQDGRGVQDCHGHGTHVSGTVAGTSFGVAKEATVVPVRVLDCKGSGYATDTISAINWIIATHPGGPAVINLSLGGSYSSTVNNAITQAVTLGFVVVVAAGNDKAPASLSSPASATAAITVGATDKNDVFASYSNYGSIVDINAPGTGITSASIGSSIASATLSGTSMATPHVAGAAARVLQGSPNLKSDGVLAKLKETSGNLVTGALYGTTNKVLGLPVATPTPTASATPTATVRPTGTPTPTVTPTSPSTPTPTVAPSPNTDSILTFTPTWLKASAAQLSWTTDSQNWVGFKIKITQGSSSTSQTFLVGPNARTFKISNLRVGQTYTVAIHGYAYKAGALIKSNEKSRTFTMTASDSTLSTTSTPESSVPTLSETPAPSPVVGTTPTVVPTPIDSPTPTATSPSGQ